MNYHYLVTLNYGPFIIMSIKITIGLERRKEKHSATSAKRSHHRGSLSCFLFSKEPHCATCKTGGCELLCNTFLREKVQVFTSEAYSLQTHQNAPSPAMLLSPTKPT